MSDCVAGTSCVLYDRRERRAGMTESERDPLCAECLTRAATEIGALPRAYRDLASELVPADRGQSHRVSGDDDNDTAVPIALDVEALQRDIFWQLTVWEPVVRERDGLCVEQVHNVRPAWAVAAACRVIVPRVQLLARVEPTWGYADGLDAGPVERNGVEAIGALRALYRRARFSCGLTRLVVELPGECSRCGASALSRADGSDTVRCAVCDERWTVDDYRRYVGLMLELR